ncbi:NUDIX hydrolase [Streptomyces sp. NPDC060198]|uniref:NUDIX hydrolase n=1 Tax=Streptomyces sp. NPDC060198 TaxID=3347070 RepID=UPI003655103C
MPIPLDHLRTVLAGYADEHPEDKDGLAPVFAALDRDDDPTSRSTSPLHVTAGAVLIDDAGNVLLIHHNATGKWLTPGGHLEPEDTGLMRAALRELAEETGVDGGFLPILDTPVHVDVHDIPENSEKGEPAHQHADFRFVFRTVREVRPRIQEEEVSAAEWRPLDDLPRALRNRVAALA